MTEAEELTTELRKVGLYESLHDAVQVISGPNGLMVRLDLVVGELAFTNRVQDPEQDQIDRTFAALANSLIDDDTEIIEALRKEKW